MLFLILSIIYVSHSGDSHEKSQYFHHIYELRISYCPLYWLQDGQNHSDTNDLESLSTVQIRFRQKP